MKEASTETKARVASLFFLGLALILLYELPYVVLREQAHIRIHDTLEPMVAIHSATRIPGSHARSGLLPFILNGLPEEAVAPDPALMVLLFKSLPLLWAYRINDLCIRVVALAGMLLLLRKLGGKDRPVMLGVSVAFALCPYWTMGASSSAGLPFLAWATITCLTENATARARTVALFVFALYPFHASLAYIGIFVLPMLCCIWCVYVARMKRPAFHLIAGIALITVFYTWDNWSLIFNQFSPNPIIWQREENTIQVAGSLRTLMYSTINLALKSHDHANANPYPLIHLSVLILLAAWFGHWVKGGREGLEEAGPDRSEWLPLVSLCVAIGVIAATYFLYWEQWIFNLRTRLGIGALNLARMYFFYPFLFYLLFYQALIGLRRQGRWFAMAALALIFGQVLNNAYQAELFVESNAPSYVAYKSERIFEAAADLIGRERSSYKIACLGIYPSVAHLNGFHTVGGYWYLYPLSYKHRFRHTIARELDKSKSLREYFDHWGNRVYLFSAELGMNFYITKNEGITAVSNLEIDANELRAIGAEYVFSSVSVENAKFLGWSLLDHFHDASAAIDLYVYSVTVGWKRS